MLFDTIYLYPVNTINSPTFWTQRDQGAESTSEEGRLGSTGMHRDGGVVLMIKNWLPN